MTRNRYDGVAQSLHWLTAILVLVAFVLGPSGAEQAIYAEPRDLGRERHRTLGLCVFSLTLVRLLWRLYHPPPDHTTAHDWINLAAKAGQWALYGLLLALPITAVTGAWLEGHALTLFGGARIDPMLARSHDLGARIAQLHTWLGDALLWLAGVHAFAALYHHAILKDGVLGSMLPRRPTHAPIQDDGG